MTQSELLDTGDLPPHLCSRAAAEVEPESPVENALEQQERALVERALADARGNQSVAAKSLNIGRDALRYKMKKHNLL